MSLLTNQYLVLSYVLTGIQLLIIATAFSFFAYVFYRLMKVKGINKKIKNFIRIKNPKFKHYFKEGASIGTGLGAMSLYDIYSAHSDHEHVFNVIEERFPLAMGNADSIDWLNKVSSLEAKGQAAIKAYISNYAGEMGELGAITKLEELGYTAVKQFESKTHALDDLMAINSDGETVSFSVKSYDNLVSFNNIVSQHPESTHYVVNSEIFKELEISGNLIEYKMQGVEIIDGGFSHAKHVAEATLAIDSMSEAADIHDDIPFLAIGFLGYKTFKNMESLYDGKQSVKEFGVNFMGDAAGIGLKGAGATVGAKAGAAVGSMFLPGVGTIAGGIAGAIVGALAASGFIEGLKEEFKWGKIIKCIDHFGDKYYSIFMNGHYGDRYLEIENKLLCKYFNTDKIEAALIKEKKMLSYNRGIWTRLGLKPLTINQALSIEYVDGCNKFIKFSRANIRSFFNGLREIFYNSSLQIPEHKREKIMKRIVGEFVVENVDDFSNSLSFNEKQLISAYKNEVKSNPNHPYKITSNSKEYIKYALSAVKAV